MGYRHRIYAGVGLRGALLWATIIGCTSLSTSSLDEKLILGIALGLWIILSRSLKARISAYILATLVVLLVSGLGLNVTMGTIFPAAVPLLYLCAWLTSPLPAHLKTLAPSSMAITAMYCGMPAIPMVFRFYFQVPPPGRRILVYLFFAAIPIFIGRSGEISRTDSQCWRALIQWYRLRTDSIRL
jgi:hypothetical protein